MKKRLRSLGGATLAALCLLVTAALIVPRFMGHEVVSQVDPVKSDIASLESAIKLFRLDCGRYPTTLEGLNALRVAPSNLAKKWKGPYLDHEVPHDKWGNAYVYRLSGQDSYIVESYGSDGKPGGDGDAADIMGGSN